MKLMELYELQDKLPPGWFGSLSREEVDYAISVWRDGIELVGFGLTEGARREIDRVLEELAVSLLRSE